MPALEQNTSIAPVARDRPFDQGGHGGGVGDVDLLGHAADLRRDLLGRRLVAVDHHHLAGARGVEGTAQRGTDTAGTARDDDDCVLDVHANQASGPRARSRSRSAAPVAVGSNAMTGVFTPASA